MENLILLTPSIKTGGGNRVFIELANRLCDKYNVYIIYPNNSTEKNTFSDSGKVKYIQVGKFSFLKTNKVRNLFRCISYANRMFDRNTKLIISDPIFCLFIPFVKNRSRVFRFVQADDYRIYDDGNILGKGLSLKLYKIFCLNSYNYKISYIFNSRFVYNQYCLDAKRNDVPYKLVYPAINHTVFINDRKTDDSVCSICLVARKHPWKGLITFINVYQKLPIYIKSKIGSVTLISHDDLSEFDTIGMNVVKPSCDEDIARVYQTSDIFISTSWWEGFGLPPLEAMACGCAVITSKSGGVNEFAVDNSNCLMFEPKNELELTDKLIRLINDKNLRNRLSQEGVKTAESFDWDKSAMQLINIL